MIAIVSKYANKQLFGEEGYYPAWKKTREIPINIIKEYPTYILCEVLPHTSRSMYSCGPSTPYRVTIDKDAIEKGWIRLI